MHTPVSIYLKLRDHYIGSILLESSEYQSKENSYSYICCNPISTFKVTNNTIETLNIKRESTIIKNEKEAFISELSNFINSFDSNELDLPFCYNGVFGYTSYDSIEFAENLTFNQKENEDKSIPLVLFSVYEYVFVMDQYSNELFLIQNATSDKKPDYSI